MSELPKSILTKYQQKQFEKEIVYWDTPYIIKARVRFDDRCDNGYNSFSITGNLEPSNRKNGPAMGGCIHAKIEKHFPDLTPYIKYHLVSTNGPMYYVENTLFHVEEGNLDYARSSAVWPEATDEELLSPILKELLLARLPKLMTEFKAAVESLGFIY